MLPSSDDCNECKPGARSLSASGVAFSSLPFLATFLLVSSVVLQKLFPLLAGHASSNRKAPPFNPSGSTQSTTKRVAALTCSTTIALAAVLAELILCEISNSINPQARRLAFHLTVPLLLFLLVLAIPYLEIHSLISATGWESAGNGKGRARVAGILQLVLFLLWLAGFWWSGEKLLGKQTVNPTHGQSLRESCLERVGVIGISFMALLSGFASVSNPWQTLGSRPRPVTEADITRKSAGLDATNDMLATKQSRLRALERKMADVNPEGFLKKAIGSIRGNSDATERKTLELEISGLETMALSLSASSEVLQSRYMQQKHSKTATGRLLLAFSYGFSLFCLYRILTTTLAAIRRFFFSAPPSADSSNNSSPSSQSPSANSDPVTTLLTLLARHYDPTLAHDAYTRQLSFLFSFIILLASFNSVMQTFNLFARFFPKLMNALRKNLALVVAQVCGMYVIGAALMLRGRVLPGKVVGEGLRGLVGGVEVGWVDGWFEKWFLGGVLVTGAGIAVGRSLAGEEWEDEEDLEMGKMS
ncbi:MAG: hypothetical protein LQ351_005567 [Letrouitia transgressa]|nr:MAG: hypothetical protein LQ351_005567 [Letrouitia transgressa]